MKPEILLTLYISSVGSNFIPTYSSEPTPCETKTASICSTSTSLGITVSSTFTITTTAEVSSSCATIFGCEASSTATSITTASTAYCSSAPTTSDSGAFEKVQAAPACPVAVTYIVWPMDGTDPSQTDDIYAHLQSLSNSVTPSTTKNFGVNYWAILLTDSEASTLRNYENVCFPSIVTFRTFLLQCTAIPCWKNFIA